MTADAGEAPARGAQGTEAHFCNYDPKTPSQPVPKFPICNWLRPLLGEHTPWFAVPHSAAPTENKHFCRRGLL